MAVWFTADTHFGHAGALALHRRPFEIRGGDEYGDDRPVERDGRRR